MPSQQDIDYGKLGAKYGKRGGRPSSKGELHGMATVEYNEIVAFLTVLNPAQFTLPEC